MRAQTPPEDAHALPPGQLAGPGVTLYGARRDGVLLGVGALRRLDAGHAEIKSMHTLAAARGQGVGRAMLGRLLAEATAAGCARVSLETGSGPEFAPARAMYAAAGFEFCGPFGSYAASPNSVFMSLVLARCPAPHGTLSP
jgi:putative acetyltransferase